MSLQSQLGTRKNPGPLRLALCTVMGIVITAVIFFVSSGTAKANPPGDSMGPSTGHEQVYDPPSCNSPAWSPTLGFDCTETGQAISDDVAKTVGAAGASCLAASYYAGWLGCKAAALGSVATAWTGWGFWGND
jgi:hypothetical protein